MADGSELLQNEVVVVQLGLPPSGTYVFHDGLKAILIRVRSMRIVPRAAFSCTSCAYDAGWWYALSEHKLVDFKRESLEAHVIEQVEIVSPGARGIGISPFEAVQKVTRFRGYQHVRRRGVRYGGVCGYIEGEGCSDDARR